MEKSRRKKGNDFELKIKHELEAKGFRVFKPIQFRFADKDVFGIFDLLGWNEKTGELSFIQATISTKRKDYTDRVAKAETFDVKKISVEVRGLGENYMRRFVVGRDE